MENFNMNKKNADQAGFSLVETVVTASIISVLFSLSSTGYSFYRMKAERAEAFHSLGVIKRLILIKNTALNQDSLWEECDSDGCLLTSYRDTENCERANPIDFSINCSSNFYYRMKFDGNSERYVIMAHQKPHKGLCQMHNIRARHEIIMNWCGKVCLERTYNPNDCSIIRYNCGSHFSCN